MDKRVARPQLTDLEAEFDSEEATWTSTSSRTISRVDSDQTQSPIISYPNNSGDTSCRQNNANIRSSSAHPTPPRTEKGTEGTGGRLSRGRCIHDQYGTQQLQEIDHQNSSKRRSSMTNSAPTRADTQRSSTSDDCPSNTDAAMDREENTVIGVSENSSVGGSTTSTGNTCSQQRACKDPEGVLPDHRGASDVARYFASDLPDQEIEDLTADEFSADGGDQRPTSASPGIAPLEIRLLPKVSESLGKEHNDGKPSFPTQATTPPQPNVDSTTTPSKIPVAFAANTIQQGNRSRTSSRDMPQNLAVGDDAWRPADDSLDETQSLHMQHSKEQQQQSEMPSQSDQGAPQESDMSVFSVHSIPRFLLPSMVQHSPAIHSTQFASIPNNVHQPPTLQAQHSMVMASPNRYGHYQQLQHQQHQHQPPVDPTQSQYGMQAPLPASQSMPPSFILGPPAIAKRKVHLTLVEDTAASLHLESSSTGKMTHKRRRSFLSFRRRGANQNTMLPSPVAEETARSLNRGRLTVSWYEGTTTHELMQHVRNAVSRKLELPSTTARLGDILLLDETTDPPEEVVLSPYIPNGSRLLLRFTTKTIAGDTTPPNYSLGRHGYDGEAPDSPSAAPSLRNFLDLHGLGLNSNQLAVLGDRLKGAQHKSTPRNRDDDGDKMDDAKAPVSKRSSRHSDSRRSKSDRPDGGTGRDDRTNDDDAQSRDDQSSVYEMQSLHPEDSIQKSLQNITELLLLERQKQVVHVPRQEKRHVITVLANYFVLFLSLIAISAEIQARVPEWNKEIERHLNNVKNCSKDQDALFECVSNGDLAGLVASVVLWISRSAATKRIFLFGFDTPRKLWTVVYESLVTAVCWGFSYMFIRRGLNPDTSTNFLQKYWKDAVYGSLAGFNAAFMKHVLKNLIPQEAIEDALQERQLKILSWLPSFA